MIKYDINTIIEINNSGLKYKDEEEKIQFIDFNICRDNWINHINNTEKHITCRSEIISNISINNTVCVGQRDWFSEKPYFEFFSNNIIRFQITPKRKFFEIFNKNWRQKYYKCFYNIQKKIEDSGWSTFDLG